MMLAVSKGGLTVGVDAHHPAVEWSVAGCASCVNVTTHTLISGTLATATPGEDAATLPALSHAFTNHFLSNLIHHSPEITHLYTYSHRL